MEDFDYGRTYFPIYALMNYNHMLIAHTEPMSFTILPDTFSKILHQQH